MPKIDEFGQNQEVSVTVLVDNRADLIVESTDTVKYFTDKPLLAEHGFAALVALQDADVRVLWDAGITKISLMENIRRMEIAPATITSHGWGKCQAAATNPATTMQTIIDQILSRAGRSGSACRHQRISRNNVPKQAR